MQMTAEDKAAVLAIIARLQALLNQDKAYRKEGKRLAWRHDALKDGLRACADELEKSA